MKKIISYILILLPILILSACQTYISYDIIVTDYVAYDFTKAIVKDTLDIKLITPIGSDFHNFEPTSQDLVEMKQVDVFIYLSFDQNPWLVDSNKLENLVKTDALTIGLSDLVDETEDVHEGHDEHLEHGSHFWTDPLTAVDIISHLTEALIIKYPNYEAVFLSQSESYQNEILETTNLLETFLETQTIKDIYYVGHHALQMFESHFGLTIHALEDSINPSGDVTSIEISSFINVLKNEQIKYLFVEEVKSRQTANYIKDMVGNMVILELHGYHTVSLEDWNLGVTYNDLFYRNYENIKEALING